MTAARRVEPNFFLQPRTMEGEAIDRVVVRLCGVDTTYEEEFRLSVDLENMPVAWLEPGPYDLKVEAGAGWWGPGLDYRSPVHRRITIPSDGSLTESVVFELRSRLLLGARSTDGRPIRAHCVIRNAQGESLSPSFVKFLESSTMKNTNGWLEAGVSWVYPNPLGGRYTIEISADGHETSTIEVELRAGFTTERIVILAPK